MYTHLLWFVLFTIYIENCNVLFVLLSSLLFMALLVFGDCGGSGGGILIILYSKLLQPYKHFGVSTLHRDRIRELRMRFQLGQHNIAIRNGMWCVECMCVCACSINCFVYNTVLCERVSLVFEARLLYSPNRKATTVLTDRNESSKIIFILFVVISASSFSSISPGMKHSNAFGSIQSCNITPPKLYYM